MRIYEAALEISGGIPAPVVSLAAETWQQYRKDLKLNHDVRWALSLHPSLLPLPLEQGSSSCRGAPAMQVTSPSPEQGALCISTLCSGPSWPNTRKKGSVNYFTP